jgi:hypothetical protein
MRDFRRKPFQLRLLDRVVRECGGERHELRRDRRLPVRERLRHSRRQEASVKLELPRQQPQVEEVLQTAVELAELDHRFDFLGHDRLTRIRA